jgi:hypothetical protein
MQVTSKGFDVTLFVPGRIVTVEWDDEPNSTAILIEVEVNPRLKNQTAVDNMTAHLLTVEQDHFAKNDVTFDQIVSVGEMIKL